MALVGKFLLAVIKRREERETERVSCFFMGSKIGTVYTDSNFFFDLSV